MKTENSAHGFTEGSEIPDKPNTMENLTKEQAIAAMKEGKKVRHRYFSEGEWMMMDQRGLVFEDSVSCSFTEFWQNRRTTEWEIDWSIVEESTASGSVAAPKKEPKEESELIKKLKSIQPDFDKLQSYQHGFHDGVGVAIDMIETSLIKKSQKL